MAMKVRIPIITHDPDKPSPIPHSRPAHIMEFKELKVDMIRYLAYVTSLGKPLRPRKPTK